eukprot:14642138-Ditylum_brightwellii.AAC.1
MSLLCSLYVQGAETRTPRVRIKAIGVLMSWMGTYHPHLEKCKHHEPNDIPIVVYKRHSTGVPIRHEGDTEPHTSMS